MSPTLQKILYALEKADSIPAKEKERLRKELEKTEKTLQKKDTQLSAQARELEIESALERIRARSMAMHSTEELNDVLRVMFQQIEVLGIDAKCAHLTLMDLENNTFSFRITGKNGAANMGEQIIDLNAMPIWKETVAKWKKAKAHSHQCLVYAPEILPDLWKLIDTSLKSLPAKERIKISDFPNGLFDCEGHHKFGYIGFNNSRPPTEEEISIAIRFAREFERVYQRFLEIKKAEAQAREAQIETALEKVRSASLAMHQSEDLHNVLVMLYNQLAALGLKMHSAQISESIEDPKAIHSWIVTNGVVYPEQVHAPFSKNIYFKRFREAVTNGESFYTLKLSKQQKDKFFHYIFVNSSLKNVPQERKDYIFSSPGLRISNAMGKYTSLSIMRYDGILYSEEENEIIKRFAKVLEQSYTRFLDIQKAESQAREAQIEAALEKVRSRTMAMHKSQELHKVVLTVSQEIRNLGLNISAAHIYRFEEGDKGINMWIAGDGGLYPNEVYFPYFKHQFFDGIYHARTTNKTFFTMSGTSKKEKNRLYRHLLNSSKIEISEDRKKYVLDAKSWAGIVALGKYSGIGVLRLTEEVEEEFSVEEYEILKRLSKVFEQAYIRFLDLQKAEAQAREAQIEASLERIRAKTMAMHSSEELNDVLSILFQQFDVLGIKPLNVWLSLYNLEENTFTYRATGTGGSRVQGQQVIDLAAMDIWQEQLEQWKSGNAEPVLVTFYPPEVLPQLMEVFKETFDAMPAEERMDPKLFPDGGYNVQGYTKFGYIGYNHLQAPTQEEKDILLKFATEFERVYQRFMEIKKAEGQAREAQIEAALERVRAASMAMHKTGEISEVVTVLFDQLNHLNVPFLQIWITILNLDKDYFDIWFSPLEGVYETTQYFTMPSMYFEDTAIKTWRSKAPFSYRSLKSVAEVDEFINACDAITGSTYFSHGRKIKNYNQLEFIEARHEYGFISKSNTEPPTETEANILQRFAKVFEQAYTRFLDIEKAEAQARESQIEAALEKVRSQSLAMHSTGEMQLVANAVFEQLQALGLEMDVVGMSGVIGHKQDYEVWIGGAPLGSALRIPYNEDTQVQRDYNKMLRDRPELFVRTYSGKVKKEYIDRLLTHGEFPKALKKKMETSSAFTTLIAPKKNSGIQVVRYTDQPFTDQDAEILKRFAGVFEQAYIRFMDLEKAEAQAREAQIEASLERIRAKAMAMHVSSELNEVLSVLFEQFNTLGINPVWAHLSLIDLEENTFTYRMSRADKNNRLSGQVVDLDARPEWQDAVKAFKSSKPNSVSCLEFPKEVLPQIWELFEESFSSISEEYPVKMEDFPNGIYNTQGYCKFGYIGFNHNRPPTEEEKEIVVRIANEFGRVYQRFLDLQKAEAQAREAQIEAALERVRARTMAMHKSEELGEVASVLFEQISVLTNAPDRFNIGITNEEDESIDIWVTDQNGHVVNQLFVARADKSPVIAAFFNSQKTKKSLSLDLHGKALEEWVQYMNKEVGIPFKKGQLKEHRHINSVYFSHGFIGVTTNEPLAEDTLALIGRFAKVFQQTYTRFLDLQRAEAQAREAQIEAALERVRARTMAMHNTEDIAATVTAFFNELMGLHQDNSIRCGIGILSQSEHMELWTASVKDNSETVLHAGTLDMSLHPLLKGAKENWRKKGKAFSYTLKGKDLKNYFRILNEAPDYPAHFDLEAIPKIVYHNSFVFRDGFLFVFTESPLRGEIQTVLERFAAVFGQTYTRYLDLQKAEAQARESQIQLALERVRARSLAMQSSDELHEVLGVLFRQFDDLGIQPVNVFLSLFDREKRTLTYRASGKSGKRMPGKQVVEVDSMEELRATYDKWLTDNSDAVEVIFFPKEVLPELFGIFSETFSSMPQADRMSPEDFPEGGYSMAGYTPFGYLGYDHQRKATEEEQQILSRFCTEFTRVYQRFLDLQKVEAQAREARIEAALEKVRSQSLAMHTTSEMQQVANAIYEQLHALGLDMAAVGMSGVIEAKEDYDVWVGGVPFGKALRIPYNEQTKIQRDYNKAIKDRPELFARTYTGKVKEEYINHLLTHGSFPAALKKKMKTSKAFSTSIAFARNSSIQILRYTDQPYSEEDNEILKRFSKVFEQAYIRFRDLERAEVQAREAQIESALERVRSRSLAMQKPDELQEVVAVVGEKLQELGVILDSGGVVICTYFPDSKDVMHWTATFDPAHPSVPYYLPYFDTPIWKETWASKWESDDDFFEKIFSFKDKNHFFHKAFEISDYKNLPEEHKKELLAVENHALSFAWQTNSALMIPSHNGKLLPEEHKTILKRFAKVFEQAYIRFMDLQKAEAQARESKIEMALERVRSRTMAMHKSEELGEVAAVLFEQISSLTYAPERFNIAIGSKEEESFDIWVTDQKGHEVSKRFMFQADKSPVVREVFNAWEKEPYIVQDLHGKKLQEWVRYMQEEIGLPFDEARLSEHRYINSVFFSHGCIGITTNEPPEEEVLELISRFAKVFQQTYVRFLDLQKAETQARESQIEVALERVRSRAMAMHHSDELTAVLGVLFDQFDFLGINPVLTHLTLFDEENETFTLRITTGGEERTIAEQLIDVNAVESWKTSFANWKKSELHAVDCIDYPPEVLPAVWEVLDGVMSALPEGQKLFPEDFPNGLYTTQGHCKYGYIGFNHSRRATEEEKEIVIRFAKEFGRLYQRFLDIQKAETQAREAQIEGALERVRSKTMAMHNSEDLEDIVISLFDEVMNLGLDQSIRCGIGILEGHEGMETRSVNKSSDGTVKLKTGMLDMTIHPMLVGLKKAWKNKSAEYSYDYTTKDVRKYYEVLNNEPEYPFNADLETLPEQEFHRSFFFSSGIIFAFSKNPISEESSKILARFATVFGQTYQRFIDLQKAEERAKDAVKQASLDRVRGQIASMRSAEDLERITPLVWNELTILGIPFIRCGVFIIEESNQTVQAFLSAPDGRSLGAMQIPFDAEKNTAETVAHWQKGEVYRTHWDKRQFLQFMQNMIDLGQINNNKEYQGAEEPPESLHLHFVPFTQGMLYVGSEATLTEDQIELVQSLADAFAIAYARYEDFSNLEKAKERVETTLSELKATQNQLVQSEKMASLGELTAGIAHEIQNPLNFVNNFSEVSIELIEEMLEEIQKGDVEEVKALAEDIIQNLEKINHHGKRADGIVKGMLQHSRASSGEKEATDINVLADEYLRLAYHGLRAKDKSFNATLETHFDESIGKVNVMTQDMGRVILNLITNAFYVVKEKKEQHPKGYEPTVTVSTKKTREGIEIRVKDNGNGIPKKVLDKIFQPFFTTKPTGQGTGLGLSMSYDIVTKGHGGDLKVDTKEGRGSTFTISIPVS